MLCCCLEQLTASILTHTGPGEAPTTGDVRERAEQREIEEANGVITSIHPRWQQHREREGGKGQAAAARHAAIHQFKDHFRCRGGGGSG